MTVFTPSSPIVAIINQIDFNYSHRFEACVPKTSVKFHFSGVEYLMNIVELAEKHNSMRFVCTRNDVLQKLLFTTHSEMDGEEIKKVSIYDFAGSVLKYGNIEILILPPLQALTFGRDNEFLFTMWCEKLTNPNFPQFPDMEWEEMNLINISDYLKLAKESVLIGIDIETRNAPVKDEVIKLNPKHLKGMWTVAPPHKTSKKLIPVIPMITMVGYTFVTQDEDGNYKSKTAVLVPNCFEMIQFMRAINEVPAAKVMHKGDYDASYFLRYNAPVTNYVYDTFVLMHSWVCELKRNLNFTASLFNRYHFFWKDDGVRSQTMYCAKDVHNTTWAWIHMVDYLSTHYPWAISNYAENFRYTFPTLQCGMEGIKVDEVEMKRLLDEETEKLKQVQKRMDVIIHPDFNCNSSKQVGYLIKACGVKDIEGTDKVAIEDFRMKHPLFDLLGGLIKDYRKYKTAISTYFTATLFDGRYLYSIGCAVTDTSRFNSNESNFWCGGNIQNQPVYAKSMYIPDEGYEFNCVDNSQAESRTTAYLSEDENLIRTVEDKGKDFHRVNCTLFFGVAYEAITKELRELAKRVNHGSNYNMGWYVLSKTMGLKNVLKARNILKLSVNWGVKKICEYLLETFDKAYPKIKGKYYNEVIRDVETTGLLIGPTGWTRKCFGNPRQNKLDLNSYVAHGPQSFAVKLVNRAFFKVWRELQIEQNKIRLKAQVHDEIFWQNKPEDTSYCADRVSEIMAESIEVRGRVLVIPNERKLHGKSWKDLKG